MTPTALEEAKINFNVGADREFEIDLVEGEMKLEELGVDTEPGTTHLPKIIVWIEQEKQTKLSFSQAMKLRDSIRCAYVEFKKKQDEGLRLSYPLAFDPFPSQNGNTNSSVITTPES